MYLNGAARGYSTAFAWGWHSVPDNISNVSLVNTENLTTTEFDPQLAVVFDIRLRSTNGNGKSPNVSQNRVNWTLTPADRILPVGNGGVLRSSKLMPKMRVNPYRDRAKSFYQRYVIM